MSKQLKQSTIADFSQRVVDLAELPNGCSLRFTYTRTKRQVRSDFTVKRKHVTATNLSIPDGDDTLATFLQAVGELLSTDLKARGIEIQLIGPNGEFFAGNTHMKTIRALPGLPPEDDDDTVALFGQILLNAGLGDELSKSQTQQLYRELKNTLSGFEGKLSKSADVIRDRANPANR